jgi:hypothetical protein
LSIEVADSSLKLDRQEKAELYARVVPFRSGEVIAPLAFADVELRVDEVFGG